MDAAYVTTEKLSSDMQASAGALVESTGLVPQSRDQPLNANDLLFYLDGTSMPMADFLQAHGLFVDGEGLHESRAFSSSDQCRGERRDGVAVKTSKVRT
ncbi:MAG: hypothetical protein J0H80_22815 [Rhizobiales bacterium]|nr:hypothetical protein [Hyphomicrobiales bacterium]